MKQLIKPKKTIVAEIPKEWELSTIDSFLKINMGQSPPSENYNDIGEGLPFYQGVSDFGNMFPKPRIWCSKPKKIANKNEILFSVRAPVGELNITIDKCCIGRGVASLIPINSDVKYCFYLLNLFKNKFDAYSQGSTFEAINRNEIGKVKLLFTSNVKEQQKIASILSKVDELIQKTEQIIEQTQRLKKGLLQRLLTQGIEHTKFKKIKLTFHEFDIPQEWNLLAIEDITEFVTYGLTVRPKYLDEGIPLISAKEIRTGEIDFKNAAKISTNDYNSLSRKEKGLKDDVFLNKTGTIGLVARAKVNHEFAITQNIASLRLKKNIVLPEFLEMFLRSDLFLKAAYRTINTTTIPDLQLGEIKKIKIPIPKIDEQRKITYLCEIVFNEFEYKKQFKLKLEILKKGLMQQLLSGKLRVKV